MTHPRELIALITRLRKSGQPLKQVRLLLKLWQAVQEVPRRERTRLLRRLGMEGGEELIQTFLGNAGQLEPEMAAGALQMMETISPARLKALTSRHLSPEETDQVLEMLRQALRQQAGELARPEASPEPPSVEEPAAPSPPSAEPYVRRPPIRLEEPDPQIEDVVEDVVEIAAEVIDSSIEAGEATGAVGVAAAAASVLSASAGPETDDSGEAQPQESRSREPTLEPEAEPEPEPEPAPAIRQRARPEPEPEPAAVPIAAPKPAPETEAAPQRPPGGDADTWLEALEAVPTPTSRLLKFRRLEGDIDRMSPSEVRDLMELFPAGWMRRRVLQSIFSRGLLSTRQAVGLLDELETTAVNYLWLAGCLLDRPDTDDSQREVLINRAPSATIKRLLTARVRA